MPANLEYENEHLEKAGAEFGAIQHIKNRPTQKYPQIIPKIEEEKIKKLFPKCGTIDRSGMPRNRI